MTLFKKIFDTHNSALESATGRPRDSEVYPIKDTIEDHSSDSVSDRLETLAISQPSAAHEASVPEIPSDELKPVAIPPEMVAENEQSPDHKDEVCGESMAQRAALAQRQILETQASVSQTLSPSEPAEVVSNPPASPDATLCAASPTEGRSARRSGRIKTRLLGFDPNDDLAANDPVSSAKAQTAETEQKFPVGWIVVVSGPGRGHAFALFSGATMIGRGEDQGIMLDFGDSSISRQNHAAIAYDNEQKSFFLGHGGKSNIIRLNDRPVLSTEEVSQGDLIRIGETTLRLVVLCGPDFNWGADNDNDT